MPVESGTLAAFALTAFAIVVSPGPDTMLIIRYGLTSGHRAAFAAVAGVQLGLLCHTLLAVAGISLVLASSPLLFKAVAVGGAAYLAWLGIQGLRGPGAFAVDGAPSAARPLKALRDATLCNLLNPKVIVLFIALFPNFVALERGEVTAQLVTLSATLVLINIAWQAPLAWLAQGARRFLTRPRTQRIVSAASGGVLLLFAGLMVYDNLIDRGEPTDADDAMLNPTELTANALADRLAHYYDLMFAGEEELWRAKACIGARYIVEQITNGDALYHNAYHTLMVTLVGQEIFRGRFLRHRLCPKDWLHYTLALLTHDIGYVRGALSGDRDGTYVIDEDGNRVTAPRGASDAFLTPYHVDRGKIFVRERLGEVSYIDADRLARAIELTRFPVPDTSDHQETDTEAGLVRAADLIGQLGDPNYPQRLTALFYEFVETGMNEKLGYESTADLADSYPAFFWQTVRPYIGDAIGYLELTQEGKQWVAMLHSHVFAIEKDQLHLGPVRGQKFPQPVF